MCMTENLRRSLGLVGAVCAALAASPSGAQGLQNENDIVHCVVEPKSRIEIGSFEDGIIVEIDVKRGDTVQKGQVLAKLESKLQSLAVEIAEVNAENELAVKSGQARLAYQKGEEGRARKLAARNIVPTSRIDEVQTEKELAEIDLEAAVFQRRLAQLELAQARELLSRRSVRSPVDGVVAEITMAVGEYVHEQSPIMTIVEMDPLYVELFAPVRFFPHLQMGMEVDISLRPPIDETYTATVIAIDRVFDAASSTFGVRLSLDNNDYAIPAGLPCAAHLNDAIAAMAR